MGACFIFFVLYFLSYNSSTWEGKRGGSWLEVSLCKQFTDPCSEITRRKWTGGLEVSSFPASHKPWIKFSLHTIFDHIIFYVLKEQWNVWMLNHVTHMKSIVLQSELCHVKDNARWRHSYIIYIDSFWVHSYHYSVISYLYFFGNGNEKIFLHIFHLWIFSLVWGLSCLRSWKLVMTFLIDF
jgi:hypothetical protein